MLKKLILGVSILLLGALSTSNVSYSAGKNQNNGKSLLENERELGRLVDDFSVLADKKDAHSQTFLFTENATVEIVRDGKVSLKLTGRKEIGDTFNKTLNSYDSKLWIGETDNMEEMLEVKRVFDLLDLAAGFGTKLFLIAEGEDEILLLNDLRKLIEVEKFGEG